MLRIFFSALLLLVTAGSVHAVTTQDLIENVKTSTVLIVSYDYRGIPIGRGSGFYVDDGIVITNIHVIYGGARSYRVYTVGEDGKIDLDCYQQLGRTDIRMNLEDDIAYIRAYVDCPHGSVFFADSDPEQGELIEVFGYPAISETLKLHQTPGVVLGEVDINTPLKRANKDWLLTTAQIHGGNSGGPVVQNGKVVGVAVAAPLNESGEVIGGIFIPVSVIRKGLEDPYNTVFEYTLQDFQRNTIYDDVAEEPEPESFPLQELLEMVEQEILREFEEEEISEEVDEQEDEPAAGSLFSDIDSSHPYHQAIEWGKETGVLSGYPDGSFQPDRSVNRAEFLKIVLEAKRGFTADAVTDPSGFPDTDESAWYAPYIRYAKANGIVKGYPDGTFRPAQTVNAAEALKMAYEALGQETIDIGGAWYDRYLYHARRMTILFDRNMSMSADMSRKDVVWIVWRLMTGYSR